jgi:hypothetical protein
MERFVRISAIIIVTIALVMCGLYWSQATKVRQDIMSKSDEEYILMVLRQKSADDCARLEGQTLRRGNQWEYRLQRRAT